MKELEHQHQVALFQWADVSHRQYPELSELFAVPNGGLRNAVVGAKLKAEGVKCGIPDIFLDVAKGQYHGFRAELKINGGELSDEQENRLLILQARGYHADVYYGWESVRDALCKYLDQS